MRREEEDLWTASGMGDLGGRAMTRRHRRHRDLTTRTYPRMVGGCEKINLSTWRRQKRMGVHVDEARRKTAPEAVGKVDDKSVKIAPYSDTRRP